MSQLTVVLPALLTEFTNELHANFITVVFALTDSGPDAVPETEFHDAHDDCDGADELGTKGLN